MFALPVLLPLNFSNRYFPHFTPLFRYMRIDEKHQCLSYYKSSAPGESPAGMIDLKVVKDITPYEKGTSFSLLHCLFCRAVRCRRFSLHWLRIHANKHTRLHALTQYHHFFRLCSWPSGLLPVQHRPGGQGVQVQGELAARGPALGRRPQRVARPLPHEHDLSAVRSGWCA